MQACTRRAMQDEREREAERRWWGDEGGTHKGWHTHSESGRRRRLRQVQRRFGQLLLDGAGHGSHWGGMVGGADPQTANDSTRTRPRRARHCAVIGLVRVALDPVGTSGSPGCNLGWARCVRKRHVWHCADSAATVTPGAVT